MIVILVAAIAVMMKRQQRSRLRGKFIIVGKLRDEIDDDVWGKRDYDEIWVVIWEREMMMKLGKRFGLAR